MCDPGRRLPTGDRFSRHRVCDAQAVAHQRARTEQHNSLAAHKKSVESARPTAVMYRDGPKEGSRSSSTTTGTRIRIQYVPITQAENPRATWFSTSLNVSHLLYMKDTRLVIRIQLTYKGPKTSSSNSLMSVLYDPVGHYDLLIVRRNFCFVNRYWAGQDERNPSNQSESRPSYGKRGTNTPDRCST
jgi:hypothetical protein